MTPDGGARPGCAGRTLNKFEDPQRTADGALRARAPLVSLKTLWFNTGSLCNIECVNCYIESGPRNDRLAYLTLADVRPFLDEVDEICGAPIEIGLTGGEPFLNPNTPAIMEAALSRGHEVLTLTNAMRPLARPRVQSDLSALIARYGRRLRFRVSLDHYTERRHDEERGPGAWEQAMTGLRWLGRAGARLSIAARRMWGEDEPAMRLGFARLFAELRLEIDAHDPEQLVLFPEMRGDASAPEISEACWKRVGIAPADVMCATSRMVVRPRGAAEPVVRPCTLLPYDPKFEISTSLKGALEPTPLNHPYCAEFCVLGGARCS